MANHYNDVADAYDDAFFYEPGPYQAWLLEQSVQALDLQPADKLVDVGGGTGSFTAELVAARSLAEPPLVVDPFEPMLEQAASKHKLPTRLQTAQEYAKSCEPASSDKILMKEVVHHIPLDEMDGTMKALYDSLLPGGRLLIVTRPQDVDYPFFQAATKIWKEKQPPAETFSGALERAGCERVEVVEAEYPCEIKLGRWLAMVRKRFWSTFSNLDDDEIEAGCAELQEKFKGQDTLSFKEHILLITATKP